MTFATKSVSIIVQFVKKDICVGCRIIGDMWDDYSSRYCKECWKIGEPFRKDLEFLENNFEIAKDEIQEKWEKSCKPVDKIT